jgi:serine/threonine protein kinase
MFAAQTGALVQGTTLGHYQLQRLLARGGMAEVYIAVDTRFGDLSRIVALKRILPPYNEDPDFVAMFLDEARIGAQLRHPNLIHVYEVGADLDGYYFTMEYVHGEDLRSVSKTARRLAQPLPLVATLSIIHAVAAGLHAAHEALDKDGQPMEIVHRDISPSNILVTHEGWVKVVDFGVAQARRRLSKTQSGVLKGKCSYMSPEQCQGLPLDRRSDVFALGILLYELTTGRRLFQSNGDYAVMRRIIKHDIPDPRSTCPGYPADLADIVNRALAHEPDHRFPTMQAVRAALEQFAAMNGMELSHHAVHALMQQLFPDDRTRPLVQPAPAASRPGTGLPPATPLEAARAFHDLARSQPIEEQNTRRWIPGQAVVPPSPSNGPVTGGSPTLATTPFPRPGDNLPTRSLGAADPVESRPTSQYSAPQPVPPSYAPPPAPPQLTDTLPDRTVLVNRPEPPAGTVLTTQRITLLLLAAGILFITGLFLGGLLV